MADSSTAMSSIVLAYNRVPGRLALWFNIYCRVPEVSAFPGTRALEGELFLFPPGSD